MQLFMVVHKPSRTLFVESASDSTRESILRWLSITGNWKFVEEGWASALNEGYDVRKVNIDTKGDE